MEGKKNCPKWRTKSQIVLNSAGHAGNVSRKHCTVLGHSYLQCVFSSCASFYVHGSYPDPPYQDTNQRS